jgi:DnaJ-domain-containing protein 1
MANGSSVDAIGSVSGSNNTSAADYAAQDNQINEAKGSQAPNSNDSLNDMASSLGMDKEQTHKMIANLCNSFVNTIKQCDEETKRANDTLKETYKS